MRSTMDQALRALIEGREDEASELFHEFVLQRARQLNNLMAEGKELDVDQIVDEEEDLGDQDAIYEQCLSFCVMAIGADSIEKALAFNSKFNGLELQVLDEDNQWDNGWFQIKATVNGEQAVNPLLLESNAEEFKQAVSSVVRGGLSRIGVDLHNVEWEGVSDELDDGFDGEAQLFIQVHYDGGDMDLEALHSYASVIEKYKDFYASHYPDLDFDLDDLVLTESSTLNESGGLRSSETVEHIITSMGFKEDVAKTAQFSKKLNANRGSTDQLKAKVFVKGPHVLYWEADNFEIKIDGPGSLKGVQYAGSGVEYYDERRLRNFLTLGKDQVEEGVLNVSQGDDGTLYIQHTPEASVHDDGEAEVAPETDMDAELDADPDLDDVDSASNDLVDGSSTEDSDEDDHAFKSLGESFFEKLEQVVLDSGDGTLTSGERVAQERHSPVPNIPAKDRFMGAGPSNGKSQQHAGFDREEAPKVAKVKHADNMVSDSGKVLKSVKKGNALLNKTGSDNKAKSPIAGK